MAEGLSKPTTSGDVSEMVQNWMRPLSEAFLKAGQGMNPLATTGLGGKEVATPCGRDPQSRHQFSSGECPNLRPDGIGRVSRQLPPYPWGGRLQPAGYSMPQRFGCRGRITDKRVAPRS